ncbi:low temperature requirement protein A [Streptomyces sp. KL116D]|uniref:low temperature requirement protein A n=1 Tax=Streptomyces sp. KL116D TaxID=3045152 RepID=UPI0035564AFF
MFFDLCFVAAVAQASSAFEHEIASGRAGHGLLGYALVFFAICGRRDELHLVRLGLRHRRRPVPSR